MKTEAQSLMLRECLKAAVLVALVSGAGASVQGTMARSRTFGAQRSGGVGLATRSQFMQAKTQTQKFNDRLPKTHSRLTDEDVAMRAVLEYPEVLKAATAQQLKQTNTKKEKMMMPASKALAAASVAASALAVPAASWAKGGEFGALEGGVPALVHPVMMGGLYLTTLYAGFLGWQWRRVRTLGDEINELKNQKPTLKSGKSVAFPIGPLLDELKAELGSADDATKAVLQSDISALQAFAPVDSEIQGLVATRKELTAGNYRDRHFNLASLLLFLGAGFAIEGPVNTWMRTGKLFPGPHLFAGAGIVVLWAAAAGLVPAMQKGNKFAKDLHIALNAANVGLFSWQILSGIPILQKVLEFKFGIKI
mmetsp:Transcript_15963/g.28634  ORF Transcript_15963/g.28634 Transcript_15963/m.28634 type:complete len:365 (+) Transcript_15963:92-1186(+)